jgi:WD40 repeat protein
VLLTPSSSISVGGGVSALHWSTPDNVIAGCYDHSIKIIDVSSQQVQEVMFTDHKVPTSLDSSRDLIISGHEDSLIRLWDLRSG